MAKNNPPKPNPPNPDLPIPQTSAVTMETVTADTASMTPQQVTQSRLVYATYSGPTPHPDELERYERISPGAATKLIDITCAQAAHRMELENVVVKGDSWRANVGLMIAGGFAFALLGCSTFLIYNGHDTAGVTLLGMDVTGDCGGICLRHHFPP